MWPLTEDETCALFEKLARYVGENLQLLVDRPDGAYCFRLHKERVYYLRRQKCAVLILWIVIQCLHPSSFLNRAIYICSNEAKMINNLIWAKLHFDNVFSQGSSACQSQTLNEEL